MFSLWYLQTIGYIMACKKIMLLTAIINENHIIKANLYSVIYGLGKMS